MILGQNDTLTEGIVTYHKFDNSFKDYTGNATLNNVIGTVAFVPGKIKTAASFNGNSYLDVGDTTTYSFVQNTGVFTINFWAKTNTNSITHYPLGSSGTTVQNGFYLGFVSSNFQFVTTNGVSGEYGYLLNQSGVITNDNDWHMYTLIANGSSLTLYKDSIYQGVTSQLDSFASGNSFSTLQIGKIQNYGLQLFQGELDELGFWNRAITIKELNKLYNNNFGFQYPFMRILDNMNGNINQGLASYYKLDGNSNDSVGINNGTDTSMSYVTGKADLCGSFNGTTSQITLADSIPTTGTIAFWINPSNLITEMRPIYKSGFYFYIFPGGGIAHDMNNTGAFGLNITLQTNTWQHIILTWDGSVRTSYLNGVQTSVNGGGTHGSFPFSLVFGSYGGGDYFDGKLDDIRIYNNVLTASQSKELFKIYKNSTIELPTIILNQPPNLKNNLVASWNFDSNFIDATGNGYDMTPGGSYTFGTPAKIGQSLILNNSYFTATFNPTPALTDFTYSFWYMQTAFDTTQAFFFNKIPNEQSLYVNNVNGVFSYYQFGAGTITTPPLNLNTFYLITLTVKGTVATFYINSKKVSSGTGYGTPYSFDNFGYNGYSTYLIGNVDILSIWNRALNLEEITYYYKGQGIQYPF